jgi:hypothetical protein
MHTQTLRRVTIQLFCLALLITTSPSHSADLPNNPYRITYANGVTVEILAVSVSPSRGKPFWSHDGARLNALLTHGADVNDRMAGPGFTAKKPAAS